MPASMNLVRHARAIRELCTCCYTGTVHIIYVANCQRAFMHREIIYMQFSNLIHLKNPINDPSGTTEPVRI